MNGEGFPHQILNSAAEESRIEPGRKKRKTVPITFRTTPQKKQQILRLADRLSLSEDATISLTEVIEHAVDVLEESLKR